MKRTFCVVLFLIAPVLIGCARVTVDEPIGAAAVPLDTDQWEGRWQVIGKDDSDVALVDVLDADNGVLRVQGYPMRSADLTVQLRSSGNWVFANYRLTDAPDDGPYEWVRVDLGDERVLYWEPVHARFAELVQEGLLPGTTSVRTTAAAGPGNAITEVALRDLGPAEIDRIMAPEQGVLFGWEEPVVLIRSDRLPDAATSTP